MRGPCRPGRYLVGGALKQHHVGRERGSFVATPFQTPPARAFLLRSRPWAVATPNVFSASAPSVIRGRATSGWSYAKAAATWPGCPCANC